MPEYPLLPLPAFERGNPPGARRFVPSAPMLPRGRQGERIGPIFERLANVLEEEPDGLSLLDDPSSIAPERALVLEVAGSLVDFQALTARVPGLEFLGDEEIEFKPDEDFFEIDARSGREGERRTDRQLGGRLYLAMPDVAALRQLLSLWERWQRGDGLPSGFTPWRDVFASLRKIRPWGPVDRLSEETISRWREEIEHDPGGMRRIEVELWFRDNGRSRAAAFRRVAEVVAEAGGRIVHHAVIEEIGYEAVLIDLPAAEIVHLVEREEVHLVISDDIMFLRPQSLTNVPEPGAEAEREVAILYGEPADLPPIAALLDGVPVQNHVLLDGRLEMDDPDGLEAMNVVAERHHGTAMASLILHGDRNVANEVLSRRLYVRPVLYAPGNLLREEPRRDRLLIDVIYRAVRRIKERRRGRWGDGTGSVLGEPLAGRCGAALQRSYKPVGEAARLSRGPLRDSLSGQRRQRRAASAGGRVCGLDRVRRRGAGRPGAGGAHGALGTEGIPHVAVARGGAEPDHGGRHA